MAREEHQGVGSERREKKKSRGNDNTGKLTVMRRNLRHTTKG